MPNEHNQETDDRFGMMRRSCEHEQKALKAEVGTLRQEIEAQEQQAQNLDKFIQKIMSYTDLKELTAFRVHDLIQKIYT